MITTSHMGLIVWDSPEDDFDHSQLASDLVAIDEHDHTSGRGAQISTGAIEAGAIITSSLANESVTASKIAKGAIGIGQIDTSFLPLGTVLQWYRLTEETPLPGGGWEVMDGRAWSGITNTMGYKTGNIPDMRGHFVKGAVATGPGAAIGDTGGASTASFAHSHGVAAHTHSVPSHAHTVPSHVHNIPLDGEHSHLYSGNFPAPGAYNLYIGHVGIAAPGAEEKAEAVKLDNITKSTLERELPMLGAGAHAHGGSTGATSAVTGNTALESGSATPATDSKLGTVSIEPPWVGLIYIMRCR